MRTKSEKLAKQHSVEHNYNTEDDPFMYIRTVWVWNAETKGHLVLKKRDS